MLPADALEEAKQRAERHVGVLADELVGLSHGIHERPELGFEERFAHEVLVAALEGHGLDVDPAPGGLETAFLARAGSEGPTVAVLCEYDALPGIGHACGHNIIATAGLGAGLAAAALADELGGQVVIMGTPAEEGGGGKVLLAREGLFDGVDAAVMVHPSSSDLVEMTTIAIQQLQISYQGQAAHAAAAPWLGRNALDAAVLGYVNVSALRQHIRPDERVHGIFTDAGVKPNIVPARAAAEWYVRSPDVPSLQVLKGRVLTALEAGAVAAGCGHDHHWVDPFFAGLITNGPMAELYRINGARTGRRLLVPGVTAAPVVGSTDMGNISHLVPSIHPMIAVAPAGVSIHTPEFTGWAAAAEGDRAVVDGARALACTVVDLWADPDALAAVRADFEASRNADPDGYRVAALALE